MSRLKTRPLIRLFALLVVLSLIGAACTGDAADTTTTTTDPGDGSTTVADTETTAPPGETTSTTSGVTTTAEPTTLEPLDEPAALTFRNSFSPTNLYGPAYAASANGSFWEGLGIAGETLAGTGSGATVQSVASGADQLGHAGFDSVLNGLAEGVPITIIAVVEQRDASGIIYTADSGVEDWADLEGRTVGSFPFGAALGITKSALEAQGVDPDSVEFVTVNPGQEMSLLATGELELLAGFAAAQDIWLRCLGTEAYNLSAYDAGVEIVGGVLIANNDWLESAGDEVVTRALYGYVQGAMLMKTDPEEVLRMIQAQEPDAEIDRALELANLHPEGYVNKGYGNPPNGFGFIDLDRLQESQQNLLEAGAITEPVDLSEHVEGKYLEHPAVSSLAQEWSETPWAETPQDVKEQCGLD